jgi:uncharacterized membrane protein
MSQSWEESRDERPHEEGPHEKGPQADDPASRPFLHVRLTSHRSLDARGRAWLLGLFALASAGVSIPFFVMGAWPVVGFFGLDVAALWWALRLCARSARAYEEVRVTPVELALAQVDDAGARRDFSFNPFWSRLDRREDDEFGLLHLFVAHRGQRVEIARVLGPGEKAEFAHALGAALAQARRGPTYNPL